MLYKNKSSVIKSVSPFEMKGNCILDITSLNSKEHVSDSDLKKVKVDGKDEVSKMKTKQLQSMISIKDFEIIKKNFVDLKERDIVMRWVLRGLSLPLAMRKTLLSRRFQYKSVLDKDFNY